MKPYTNEIKKIENILQGRFDKPWDRQYWVDKLNDYKQKQMSAIDNEKYFKKYEKGTKSKWHSGYNI